MTITPSKETLEAVAEAIYRNPASYADTQAAARAAFTAVMQSKEVPQWQPIETAPKDGTEIIGAFYRDYGGGSTSSYGPWTVAWDGKKWRSSWDKAEVVEYMSDFGTEYKEPDIQPTHWMPLPNPPTNEAEDE